MLTQEQKAEIVKLYYQGKLPSKIAELLKIGKETVRQIVNIEKEKINRQSEQKLQEERKNASKPKPPDPLSKPKPIVYKEDANSNLKLREKDHERYLAIKKAFDSQ